MRSGCGRRCTARERVAERRRREQRSPFHVAKLGDPSAIYTYRGADGAPAFYVCRYETPNGKQFSSAARTARANRVEGAAPPRPLYRLPELLADKTRPVLVVEGEKCADTAVKLLRGCAVTTWAGRAKATSGADWRPLSGRSSQVWPDADMPGREAAAEIAARITGAKVIEPGERPKGSGRGRRDRWRLDRE